MGIICPCIQMIAWDQRVVAALPYCSGFTLRVMLGHARQPHQTHLGVMLSALKLFSLFCVHSLIYREMQVSPILLKAQAQMRYTLRGGLIHDLDTW